MKNPILVTGIHRSGTTWIGKMLAASQDVTYISEPLNVLHRPGVMSKQIEYWYTYICQENQSCFLPAFQDTQRLHYHFWLELKSLRSIKDIGRMFRDAERFIEGRIRETRPLYKDPFAIFSAPWFAHRLGCIVVISVRHPLAFVSSLKRLAWHFEFRDLLEQPLLMRDYLEPFRDDMINCPDDILVQGCLLWRIVYSVVSGFQDVHPEFIVVCHEDLSRQPEDGFRDLCKSIGLEFSPRMQKGVLSSSQGGNPEELSDRKVHGVKLDSEASLNNWRKRLTPEEVSRIRHLTSDVAYHYYSEETWE